MIKPDKKLITWTSSRSSGPGGQNVNKVESKVDVRYSFEKETSLSEEQKRLIRESCKNKLDSDGNIIVCSQLTRDKKTNLQNALEKLESLLAKALEVKKARKKVAIPDAVKAARLRDKFKNSQKKSDRKRNTRETL